MGYNLSLFLELKKLRASLISNIEQLDIAINNAKPKDEKLLDKFLNEETIGVYDYRLCTTNSEKILFVLLKLGKANESDIAKYLEILGESMYKTQLKTFIRTTLTKLLTDDEIEKNGNLYSLKNKKNLLF